MILIEIFSKEEHDKIIKVVSSTFMESSSCKIVELGNNIIYLREADLTK